MYALSSLKGNIQKVMGESVRLIDSAEETASEVKEVLMGTELNSTRIGRASTCQKIFCNRCSRRFESRSRFLGERIGKVEKVALIL